MVVDAEAALAALKTVLHDEGMQKLEEAGLTDYVAGVFDGCDTSDADGEIGDAVGPLLVEAGAAEDDDAAAALCTAILKALSSSGSVAPAASAAEPIKLSGGPASMTQMVKADEAAVTAE
eukprot:7241959-Prymnesium_polylepis.1